jgi:hypothetical protein
MKNTSSENPIPCALCKQPVDIAGFCLQTGEGIKHFCCEGCLCVYQLLNETAPPAKPNNDNNLIRGQK